MATRQAPIDESLIQEQFVRSPGSGGQNVNKVATAVELRYDLAASALSDEVKARAGALAGKRLTTDGVIVIHAHEHRTQAKNREAARARLAELLQQASRRPKSRRPTKPTTASRERRLISKQKRAKTKAGRRASSDD
jgi:ribosome-associated protein